MASASCGLLWSCEEEAQRSNPTWWPRQLDDFYVSVSSPVPVLNEYPDPEISDGHMPCVPMASSVLALLIWFLGEVSCSG